MLCQCAWHQQVSIVSTVTEYVQRVERFFQRRLRSTVRIFFVDRDFSARFGQNRHGTMHHRVIVSWLAGYSFAAAGGFSCSTEPNPHLHPCRPQKVEQSLPENQPEHLQVYFWFLRLLQLLWLCGCDCIGDCVRDCVCDCVCICCCCLCTRNCLIEAICSQLLRKRNSCKATQTFDRESSPTQPALGAV